MLYSIVLRVCIFHLALHAGLLHLLLGSTIVHANIFFVNIVLKSDKCIYVENYIYVAEFLMLS